MLNDIKVELSEIFASEQNATDSKFKTVHEKLNAELLKLNDKMNGLQKSYRSSCLVNFKRVYNIKEVDCSQTLLRLLSFMRQIKKDNEETVNFVKEYQDSKEFKVSEDSLNAFNTYYQSSIVKDGKYDKVDDMIHDIMLRIELLVLTKNKQLITKVMTKIKSKMSKEYSLQQEVDEILKGF